MNGDPKVTLVEVKLTFDNGRVDTAKIIPTPDNRNAIASILDGVADFKLRWLGLPSRLEK